MINIFALRDNGQQRSVSEGCILSPVCLSREEYYLLWVIVQRKRNRIGDVMVSVFASSGLEPGRINTKTIKLLCVASPLSTQHDGIRAGWLEFRMSEWSDMPTRGLFFQ